MEKSLGIAKLGLIFRDKIQSGPEHLDGKSRDNGAASPDLVWQRKRFLPRLSLECLGEYFPKGLSTACAGSDRGRALGIPPESKIPGIAAIPTCAFPGLAGRNQIAPNQEFRREFGI